MLVSVTSDLDARGLCASSPLTAASTPAPPSDFRWRVTSSRDFLHRFFRLLKERGVQVPNYKEVAQFAITSDRSEVVHEAVKKAEAKGFDIILTVTSEKLDAVHHTVKLAEQKCGVPTMHIWKETLLRACSDRGGIQILSNLAMKVCIFHSLKGLNSSTRRSVA